MIVELLHDQELAPSILTSVPDHLPKQHSVADHEINRYELAGLIAAARPDGNDLAL